VEEAERNLEDRRATEYFKEEADFHNYLKGLLR
jgi:hypothetical protein